MVAKCIVHTHIIAELKGYFLVFVLYRVSIEEIQDHPEFDIDANGEVSSEEAMVCTATVS